MKKSILLVCCTLLLACSFAQVKRPPAASPDTAKPAATPHQQEEDLVKDTSRTLVSFIDNYNTGHSVTTWAIKVTFSRMQFVQPTAEQLNQPELTLKKQKVPVKVDYYIPVQAEVIDPKTKKKSVQTSMAFLPENMRLMDFNIAPEIPKDTSEKPAAKPPATNKK